MTSSNLLRYSSILKRINHVVPAQLRSTAAIHTCGIVRAPKQDKEILKKVDSFDYMSNMKEFDSLKSFTRPEEQERWKHEGNIIMVSLFCVCIHFFVLREENQLDERLNQPLYTTIPALELIDLGTQVTKLKKEGKDATKELARIEEIKKIMREEGNGQKKA